MGLLNHGDALWCAVSHYDALHSLKRGIPQGASTDLQLRACKTRGRGIHPPRSLPLVVLRRLSLRIASTGRRRSPHFRTVGRWAYYIWSTSVTWLPLHEHRQGNWGRSRRLCFHDSVRHRLLYLHCLSHCHYRPLESGARFAFELTERQGAALVTKYHTYREDIERESAFEEYTKRHYDSWVTFARNEQHGNDIKPVLVTGVDMTRDFAMLAYSNNCTRSEEHTSELQSRP